MVARPACRVRLDPIKAEVPQSKFIDKDINSPNRIVIADIIVKQCRKQSALVPILPDNKAHRRPLQIAGESYHIRRFHTASTLSSRSAVAWARPTLAEHDHSGRDSVLVLAARD